MKGKPCDQWTMKEVYTYYELVEETQQFVGHAMALHRDDSYLDQPAEITIDAIKLYMDSMQRFDNCKSPYIYPLYGLGGLPEGFSRLCAINGGTFMLNKDVDEILCDASGKAWAIKTGNEVAKATQFIGDASYFPSSKTRAAGKVIRAICLLDHPLANTDGAESAQIIIPAAQVKRRNDIYVCVISFAHFVASQGKYIAIVSTTCESANPSAEVQPGIDLLGKVLERFDSVSTLFAPVGSGREDKCYVSKSYDATSHFESAAHDVLSLYERITGTKLDMDISADLNEDE